MSRQRTATAMKQFNQMPRIVDLLRDLRTGPGAVRLPSTVTRIHLQVPSSGNNSQEMARQLWHRFLPRLAFNNPHVSVDITQNSDNYALNFTTSAHGDGEVISVDLLQTSAADGADQETVTTAAESFQSLLKSIQNNIHQSSTALSALDNNNNNNHNSIGK